MKIKNKLKKIIACLTVLGSFPANISARTTLNISTKEKLPKSPNQQQKQQKKTQTATNSFTSNKFLPVFAGTSIFALGLIGKELLDKNTKSINEQNDDLEDNFTYLQKVSGNIENKKQKVDDELKQAEKNKAEIVKQLNKMKYENFNLSNIPGNKLQEIISNITTLISDETLEAYKRGNLDEKKALVEKTANIVRELVISEGSHTDKILNEMIELDKMAENVGKEGILDSLMDIFNNMSKYIFIIDMMGVHLFDEHKNNSEGLEDYFKGVLDYLVPTEGSDDNLKLAKFIKKLATKTNKDIKKLFKTFIGDKLKNSNLSIILENKINSIDKIQV